MNWRYNGENLEYFIHIINIIKKKKKEEGVILLLHGIQVITLGNTMLSDVHQNIYEFIEIFTLSHINYQSYV